MRFCSIMEPRWAEVIQLLREESFKAGQLSNFGPLYEQLCTKLQTEQFHLTDKEVVVTSSGHTALMAAYSVLGIKRLAIPSYTFGSTIHAADLQKIEPVLFDIDQATGTFRLEELEKRREEYDGIVVVAPLSAIPNLERFQELASRHNKFLVVDGAATFGTPGVVSFGDIYCLSFHATKSFPVGEAGAVVCKPDVATKIRQFINFGLSPTREPVGVGMNAKASEYTCAIALQLLEQLEPCLEVRRRNARLFLKLLGPENTLENHGGPNTVYQCYTVYAQDAAAGAAAREELKTQGYETMAYYRPLQRMANASCLYENSICLPVHPDVTEEDVYHMAQVVRDYLRGRNV